jgi:hypothetical protein
MKGWAAVAAWAACVLLAVPTVVLLAISPGGELTTVGTDTMQPSHVTLWPRGTT